MDDCVLRGRIGTEVTVNGERFLFFGGNDYLGLAGSSVLEDAAIAAVQSHGASSCASRTTTGTSDLHLELETALAEFKKSEQTRVIGAGYLANRILLASVLDRGTGILLEESVHPSARDAIPREVADVKEFTRGDREGFESLARSADPGTVVMIDGVATTGEIAPIADMLPVVQHWGLKLIVDDAHGVGILGPEGRGTVAHHGFDGAACLEAASMSKAFGNYGGFISGPRDLFDRIHETAPAYIGATALPPAVLGASLKAVTLIRQADHRRERLRTLTRQVVGVLQESGWDATDWGTPILTFGQGTEGEHFHREMLKRGLYVPFIHYPDPKGPGCVRLTVSANHSDEEINQLTGAIREL